MMAVTKELSMPSPFPGMDPYLEDQVWEDFHFKFNSALSDVLTDGVEPRYIVRAAQRVYIEHGIDADDQVRLPDVAVLWNGNPDPIASPGSLLTETALAPVECLNASPVERRETYLVIRELPGLEIVTVIETLSPTNKRTSSDGRQQYLAKREEVIESRTNLVELDFLRGGKRLPVIGLPAGDFYAVVSRGNRRPRTDVYAWSIRQAIPKIPFPLKPGDPEVLVDLQEVFNLAFHRGRYQRTLNYAAALRPPLSPEDAAWRNSLTK
jgi:hypothetical protein